MLDQIPWAAAQGLARNGGQAGDSSHAGLCCREGRARVDCRPVPFAYYDRLSAARKRVYRESDAITRLDLPAGVDLGGTLTRLRDRLAHDDRTGVQRAAQAMVDELAKGFRVTPIQVRVRARRPVRSTHELHGLYELEHGRPAVITVWMRTAEKRQVVAFRTFLRTLIHEVCHHLDYHLFKMVDSFHTEGFYSRESALASALLAQEAAHAPGDGPASRGQLSLF